MKEYKRITKRLMGSNAPFTEYASDNEILNRLAELEDKIEQGELVENTVVTYVNMARSGNKTLIDKALKYDELKSKIENGTLIELPCKVGDTVYIATDKWDIEEVVEAKVTRVEYFKDEKREDFVFYLDHKYVFSKTNPNLIAHRYIFWKEELFSTKSEAEQKLKELQGKYERRKIKQ